MEKVKIIKKILIIIFIIIIGGIIWGLIFRKNMIRKMFDLAECCDYTEGLYGMVELVNIGKKCDVDTSEIENQLGKIEKDYKKIANNLNVENESDLYYMGQVMCINTYYGVDNKRFFKRLDEKYDPELMLLDQYYYDNMNDEQKKKHPHRAYTNTLDIIMLNVYQEQFIEDLLDRYDLLDGLKNVYDNPEKYITDKDEIIDAYTDITFVFMQLGKLDMLDLSKAHKAWTDLTTNYDVLQMWKDTATEYGIEDYLCKSMIDIYQQMGIDISEYPFNEIKQIADSYDINVAAKDDEFFAIGKNSQMDISKHLACQLRGVGWEDENIFKNERIKNNYLDFCNTYMDMFIPQFKQFVKDSTKRFGLR